MDPFTTPANLHSGGGRESGSIYTDSPSVPFGLIRKPSLLIGRKAAQFRAICQSFCMVARFVLPCAAFCAFMRTAHCVAVVNFM